MARVLGLDFGTKRVGVAISDPRGQIASPLEVYERLNPERDALHFRALVRENEVERIVVGLPVHTTGTEGKLAQQARSWSAWLAEETGLPVVLRDERFTSQEAEEALRAAGVRSAHRRRKIDMIAAQRLLQEYLDDGCPTHEPPPGPLDDEEPRA